MRQPQSVCGIATDYCVVAWRVPQAVELLTPPVCGLNMTAANAYRWHPAYNSGIPYAQSIYKPLSKPVEVLHGMPAIPVTLHAAVIHNSTILAYHRAVVLRLTRCCCQPQIWYFDMLNPPTSSDSKSIDIVFTGKGTFNTVMFW